MSYERDPETGAPFLGAQPCLALARMIEDDTGEVVTETMVLPNLIIFWLIDPDTGTHVGDSRVCSTAWAEAFIDELPSVVEHVSECDCRTHEGRSMTMLDPNVVLS